MTKENNRECPNETKISLVDWDNKSEAEQIKEILHEADDHNLQYEVEREAKKLIKNDSGLNEARAYEMALRNWVK